MPTTALYHWSVAGGPVNLLLDLPLVDRLRVACSGPNAEVGGILVGHFDGNYTVITDFEPVESEHRRGTAYALTSRDESRLGARIEARSRRHRDEVVGFYRSHLRPGMFLDEADQQIVSSHFGDTRQAVLLIKPAADGSATGGFFFWEDGEMNRKQTYLPFPMSSRELESGDFPLVEPVGDTGFGPEPAHFDTAETLDRPAAALMPPPNREPLTVPTFEAGLASADSATPAAADTTPPARKWNWPVIALVAAGAALGGYIVGTSGTNHDRFGSRPGDLIVGADSPQAAPAPSPAAPDVKSEDAKPQDVKPQEVAATGQLPASRNALEDKPSPMPVRQPPVPTAAATTIPVAAITPNPPAAAPQLAEPRPGPGVVPDSPWQVQAAQPTENPPTAAASTPVWSHFRGKNAVAPDVSGTQPPPGATPSGDGSVYLESVEDGGLRQALHHIPLFGRSHGGDGFVPPQAIRSFAPKVPSGLARDLTSTQPVDLKLKVDATGRVTSVELLSRGTPPDFVRLAGDAAYDWQFEPARVKDKAVPSDVIAHFRFHPTY